MKTEGAEVNGYIDKGSQVRGDLTFEDGFRKDGRFEGKIRSNSELILGETADVTADIDVGRISVSGSLKGSVKAGERVELLSKARVFADVTTPVLKIEEGAMFRAPARWERNRCRT
jgi:cytoskeletal protein CcmA (bactofilin family)